MKFQKSKNENHDLPCICEFCEHAAIINDETNILCEYRGIVDREYRCRKFIYDPLKREPKSLPPMPKLSEDDLLL